MKNFCVLNDALDYIEAHLAEEINQQAMAEACCVSLSGLQKLFRYAFHISIADYVNRRRITRCAREMAETDRSLLDIALDYGFNSAEVFTRAFTRVWGETPTQFRKHRSFGGIFPKLEWHENTTGGMSMTEIHQKYDISELYDYLNQRRGTLVIAFDIKNLVPINGISRKAGDEAIRESLRRIASAAGEDMLLLRIGGDEFALATGLTDEREAGAVADKVTALNGQCIQWEENQIPLSLYAALYRIGDRSIRYSELFPEIYQALQEAKKS